MPRHNRLRLLLSTARYLTASQIWHRGQRLARQSWRKAYGKQAPQPAEWQLAPYRSIFAGLADSTRQGAWSPEVSAALDRARATAKGRFCFLNHDVDFTAMRGWHDPELSKLWRYHLHYFDYVRDLLILSPPTSTVL